METDFKKEIDRNLPEPEHLKKTLFETILEREHPLKQNEQPAATLHIGVLTGFSPDGTPLVDVNGSKERAPIPARTTVSLRGVNNGREVTLGFEAGDYNKPVITGVIKTDEEINPPEIIIDGEKLLFEGKKEIRLRCGKASITLTRAGKILIRGAYVLNRSSGVNRIKGGSVQIN